MIEMSWGTYGELQGCSVTNGFVTNRRSCELLTLCASANLADYIILEYLALRFSKYRGKCI